MDKATPRILVCPLDWGIGHATRSVSIVREFINQGAEVVLAASGRPAAFLKNEFPDLPLVDFPGYEITYSDNKKKMVLKMAKQAPGYFKGLQQENAKLHELISSNKIDAVFSDNRLGCFSSKVPTVVLSHQIFVRAPFSFRSFDSVLYQVNMSYLRNFNEVWIPDYEDDNNLSGDLSHKKVLPPNFHFIGPQSRFTSSANSKANEDDALDVLVMISGPEPQRSLFEKLIVEQAMERKEKIAILGGKPEEKTSQELRPGLEFHSHADTKNLTHLLQSAKLIISRSGYSTLMDLAVFGKKAVFVPTPGQSEQEYLADLLMKKGYFLHLSQEKFDLGKAIEKGQNYPGFHRVENTLSLRTRVQSLIERASVKQ